MLKFQFLAKLEKVEKFVNIIFFCNRESNTNQDVYNVIHFKHFYLHYKTSH